MDLRAVAAGYALRYALVLEHAALPRYAVLCAKLVALAWLLTGQVVHTSATLLPFAGTRAFALGGAAHAIVLVQLIAILTIVCSRFVRAGCALLATAIFALALLDQPLFSNNRAFSAALLAMLALGERGVLARLQLALVYACAAADKLLEPDWRSGRFLGALARDLCEVGALGNFGGGARLELPVTCWLAQRGAGTSLFALLSAGVIATELVLAAGYLRSWRANVALAVGLHGAILLFTGSAFGMFLYACVAASLLVLDQPPNRERT